MKVGIFALIGRPSSGKSTLVNALCGEKVSITAGVPQTTRNKIRGIFNDARGQIVLIDTPGYHRSEKKLNQHLTQLLQSSLEGVDALAYLVDPTRPFGDEEEDLVKIVRRVSVPVVLIINKSDIVSSEQSQARAKLMEKWLPSAIFCLVSAKKAEGLDELKRIFFEVAPEGEPLYPADVYTDQDPEFRICEIIREKAILETSEEIPHSLYVEVADLEFRNDGKVLWARSFLIAERESQKGILIGAKGQKIKAIRLAAQKELRAIFPYRVDLDLQVRVKKEWRRRDAILKKIIR